MNFNDPSVKFTKLEIEAHINEWARQNQYSTLDQILDHAPRHCLMFIAQTGTKPLVFERLAVHPDPVIRMALMVNDNLPQSALKTLLKDPEEVILVLMCKHPATKRKWLWRLLTSKYRLVRSMAFKKIFGFHWSALIPIAVISFIIFSTLKFLLK